MSRPRYLLLANTDVELWDPDLIVALVSVLEGNADVGFVSPGIVLADQPELTWYRGATMATWTWIARQAGIGTAQDWSGQVRPVQVPSGCCLLVRPVLLDDTGGFCADLFAYFDEAEWALRARRAGWRAALLDTPMVGHDTPKRDLTVISAYYFGRNPFLGARIATPRWQWPLVVAAQCLASPVYLRRATNGAARRAYRRGFRHGVAHLFGLKVHVGEGHDDEQH